MRPSALAVAAFSLGALWLAAACAPTARFGATPATDLLGGPTAEATAVTGPTETPGFTPAPGSGLSCRDPFGGNEIAFSLAGWAETDFCRTGVDFGEIVSGGQPRDGIPPIDAPVYESADSASAWVESGWPVLVIVVSERALAFPLPILLWHEVVNTELDGELMTVTYSAMSGSGRTFAGRDLSGGPLDFGTTGNLRFGNSILYDRPSGSWWQQLSGEAIVGEQTGTSLEALPSQLLAWPDFIAEYPEGQVLSRETGTVRGYGTSPYAGMEDSADLPGLLRAFVVGEVDNRLRPMDRVTGIGGDGAHVAYPFRALSTARVVNDEVGGQSLVIFWQAGVRSLTDSARVAESRDVGSSGVYSRDLAGQVLTFEWTEGGIRDQETGSTWGLTGRAIAGPLRGERLIRLDSVEAFWFAWSALFPGTEIWGP